MSGELDAQLAQLAAQLRKCKPGSKTHEKLMKELDLLIFDPDDQPAESDPNATLAEEWERNRRD